MIIILVVFFVFFVFSVYYLLDTLLMIRKRNICMKRGMH